MEWFLSAGVAVITDFHYTVYEVEHFSCLLASLVRQGVLLPMTVSVKVCSQARAVFL